MAGDGARTRSRSRGLGCGAAAIVMMVVLLFAGGTSATLYVLASGTGKVIAPFLHAQSDSIPWNRHDPFTVLLLGSDSGTSSPTSTSSLMVASYLPRTQRLTVLSIPGNLWVTVPGFGQTQIAQAYADGGARLALLTVQSLTHIAIPYYVLVDAQATSKVISTLGDLTLDISPDASMAMSRRVPNMSYLSGSRRLDATGVLTYLGSFGPSSSAGADQIRREQRVILAAIRQDLLPATTFQIPALIDGLGNPVASNFPLNEVPQLARELGSLPVGHIQFATIGSINGTASTYRAGGTEVLLPDLQAITQQTHHLFPETGLTSDGSVTVLNGSGVLGAAASLADWLRVDQVQVRAIGSANSFNIASTRIELAARSTSSNRYLAHTLATLLQVPVVVRSLPEAQKPIVVLIGKDYQDVVQQ